MGTSAMCWECWGMGALSLWLMAQPVGEFAFRWSCIKFYSEINRDDFDDNRHVFKKLT